MKEFDHSSIPAPFQQGINKAYEHGRDLIRRSRSDAGPCAEIPAVARNVELHRWAWRPSIVKTVLVAESHVYTTAAEAGLHIVASPGLTANRVLPDSYVRFVYCLGYGESSIVDYANRFSSPNAGTPHYWALFSRLAGTPPFPKQSEIASSEARIRWKIETLNRLRDRGIWLLDASVHAIYCPGGFRRPESLSVVFHASWWTHYGQPLFASLNAPHVWVVGKGLFGTLRQLGLPASGWIYQPHVKIPPERHKTRLTALISAIT